MELRLTLGKGSAEFGGLVDCQPVEAGEEDEVTLGEVGFDLGNEKFFFRSHGS